MAQIWHFAGEMELFRPDRRESSRGGSADRRQFPRPPLWLNLTVLLIALAALGFAQVHRERVRLQYGDILNERLRTPQEVNRMKEELAAMDLSREQLEGELEGRLELIESLKSEDFYLSIDTTAKKLRFMYGNTILREGDIQVGEGRTIESPQGKSWTFVPVKGAFRVEGKLVGLDWKVPEWVYAMNGQPVPASRPVIEDGIGEYVIELPNDYIIHSAPAEESPLKGPKPGSIMASEEDLRAIWARLHRDMQVYIF